MKKLLYGVAYYDEYMPEERLDKDIEMLKKAGMNVVRIGESTWSTMEPQEGVFDTSHLTKVIEAMGKAGIDVIIGTPTYAVPTWMVKSYPDVLAETKDGRGIYGPRQIMDITHPVYLYYAERVIRVMMEACAHYDNVIGVQIDNETKAYGTAGPNVQQGFLKYLKEKFHGDLDALNAEFGFDYWSNRINAWEDFPDVRGTINGSFGAEFKRYQRKLVADFMMWQRRIVEPYLRPDQFITHNTDFNWKGFSYGLNGEVDVYEDAKATTILGTDIYHASQDDLNGMTIAFGGDVTRSVKRDNYFVLETEAQGFAQWLPFDGQLRLQAYSHLASGANMVEYWHWHSLHNAVETYWKGVLSQDFKENDTYRAASVVGNEWKRIGEHLIDLKKKNRIAVLASNTALTAIDWFPISFRADGPYKYDDVLMEFYDTLYRNNLECDVLFEQNAAEFIGEYDLVLVPALYAASQELLDTLADYVKKGGHLFVTFKSAFTDENVKVWHDETPHTLGEVCGVYYSHFTYPKNVGLRTAANAAEEAAGETAGKSAAGAELVLTGNAEDFMECVIPTTAEVLARYVHPSFGRFAAVTRNKYGEGTATYLGCNLSPEDRTALLINTAAEAGIEIPEEKFPVIVKKGVNALGRKITYYLNYSAEEKNTVHRGSAGTELIGGEAVPEGGALAIGAWDLKIVVEL